MKSLRLMILLAAGAAAAESPASEAIARRDLSLNGRWHVIVDPYDNGYVNYRQERFDASAKPTGGYFLDRKPSRPSDLIEYDFDRSPSLQVPGDWNSQDDRLLYYESTVWYRRWWNSCTGRHHTAGWRCASWQTVTTSESWRRGSWIW